MAAGTIQPPGHMQKLKTPRPLAGGLQLVEGGRQRRVAGGGAVLDAIDQRLRVLDAHAQREVLALDATPAARSQS